MTKKQKREFIKNKFGGKCAYCGIELTIKFHVDEIEPCRRKYKWIGLYWQQRDNPKIKLSIREMNALNLDEGQRFEKYKWVEKHEVPDGYEHPERLHTGNQNPSCASCNINKHGMDLEDFRNSIAAFMKHLNEISTQYKIAKRYGLIEETNKPVVFYFETFNN